MRMGGSAVGILVALLAPAEFALAANQSVLATPSNTFSPANVSVNVGETVTWTNDGGTHNVAFDDGFTEPAMASPSMWTVSKTFSTAGSFGYYCAFHGQSMSGTVAVQAAGTGPAPPPGGGGGGGGGTGQPVAADKVAPGVKLSGQRRQDVLARRAVLVTVAVNEAAAVSAKGTVSVPGQSKVFRLRKASRDLKAGAKATLKLKLPKQASRAFRRALARRVKLTARLTISAKDAAGNTRSAKRKVTLKQ